MPFELLTSCRLVTIVPLQPFHLSSLKTIDLIELNNLFIYHDNHCAQKVHFEILYSVLTNMF